MEIDGVLAALLANTARAQPEAEHVRGTGAQRRPQRERPLRRGEKEPQHLITMLCGGVRDGDR